ncbi:unnamed protein product, partial [Effrenium voratum]
MVASRRLSTMPKAAAARPRAGWSCLARTVVATWLAGCLYGLYSKLLSEEGELFRVAEAISEANAAEEAQAEETVGAEDATPWEASEDESGLQSGSPGPAWEKHEGLNCYLHHGAEGIKDKDPLGDAQTLEQCQQECLQEKDCAAIVMHGDSPTTCWLRKDVDMSRCTAGCP